MKHHALTWIKISFYELKWAIINCYEPKWTLVNPNKRKWNFMNRHDQTATDMTWHVLFCIVMTRNELSWNEMNHYQ